MSPCLPRCRSCQCWHRIFLQACPSRWFFPTDLRVAYIAAVRFSHGVGAALLVDAGSPNNICGSEWSREMEAESSDSGDEYMVFNYSNSRNLSIFAKETNLFQLLKLLELLESPTINKSINAHTSTNTDTIGHIGVMAVLGLMLM